MKSTKRARHSDHISPTQKADLLSAYALDPNESPVHDLQWRLFTNFMYPNDQAALPPIGRSTHVVELAIASFSRLIGLIAFAVALAAIYKAIHMSF
jgi:hypothetical protein